jgi:thioredoxin-related protein
MKTAPYLFLSLMLILTFSTAWVGTERPASPVEEIKWMTFEEAVEKMKTEKKKIFIDVYTDWCGYCKVMDKKTFSDPEIIKTMNANFYAVKFNAEQKEDVVFKGNTYKLIASGRGSYHQLAAALLNNQLVYPNFVFLNDEFQIIPVLPGSTSVPGYYKPQDFHPMMSYVSNEIFKKMTLEEYKKVYESPYASAK